jgi:hypothetical protein
LIVAGVTKGFLLAAFVFATALGKLQIWTNVFNFVMCFLCVMLIFPVFLITRPKLLNIISSAIVGAYFVMFGVDYFIGSGLNQIVFNVFKRISSQTFAQNYGGSYFGNDFNGCSDPDLNLGMLVAWVVGSVCGVVVQLKVTAVKLPFPVSPRWAVGPHFASFSLPPTFARVLL